MRNTEIHVPFSELTLHRGCCWDRDLWALSRKLLFCGRLQGCVPPALLGQFWDQNHSSLCHSGDRQAEPPTLESCVWFGKPGMAWRCKLPGMSLLSGTRLTSLWLCGRTAFLTLPAPPSRQAAWLLSSLLTLSSLKWYISTHARYQRICRTHRAYQGIHILKLQAFYSHNMLIKSPVYKGLAWHFTAVLFWNIGAALDHLGFKYEQRWCVRVTTAAENLLAQSSHFSCP